MVAEFLDIEAHLKRRIREETITDIIVASLVSLPTKNVFVEVPIDENKTGNDLDIIVYSSVANQAIQFRIQAKRLKPHPTDWSKGSYKELAHPNETGRQSRALIKSAAAVTDIYTVPLYAFYNPKSVCIASASPIVGIELANGYLIRSLILGHIAVKPKRPPTKRISTLMPLFFPLSRILCIDNDFRKRSAKLLPTVANLPASTSKLTVLKRLLDNELIQHVDIFESQLSSARRRYLKSKSDIAIERTLDLGPVPPRVIQQAIESRGKNVEDRIQSARVARKRIVIVSS
jgi:hypothetical protein